MNNSIYAICSEKDKRIYVGMSKDVEKRIEYHNKGGVTSTKGYKPWYIIYKEFVGNRHEARIREKYYKSGCGKEFLKKLIIIHQNMGL